VPNDGPQGTKHVAFIDDCIIHLLWLPWSYTPIVTVIFI